MSNVIKHPGGKEQGLVRAPEPGDASLGLESASSLGPGSAPSLAPESLGLAMRLESGRAILELKDRPLGMGVVLSRLEMEIPNVKFPFDVSGGAERFRSTRCQLRALVLQMSHETIGRLLARTSLAEAGFHELEAGPENGALTVTGAFAQGGHGAHFSFNVAPVIVAPRELSLLTFDERVYGRLPVPASRLPWLMLQALGGLPIRDNRPVFDVVAMSVRELLPRFGWKIPSTDDIGLISAEISKAGWIVACGRNLVGDHKTASKVAFAVESRAPFESEDLLLYRGQDDEAFTAFRRLLGDEVPARFAVRRFLQLAAAAEQRSEEGRSVAEETLVRSPSDADALLYLAQFAQTEGDLIGAARHYSLLAEVLWADKSERAAALADLAAAQAGREVAPHLTRASLARTLKKRRQDVRALRLLFDVERAAATTPEGLHAATNVGDQLLRALPEPERFSVHLAMGELLLGHDLKRAKLHAERALRADMNDPAAMLLVARIFAAGGDIARSVRYLARLSERASAEGDGARAVALELEVAAQLEQAPDLDGFDPRALLQRYQRILSLDPTQKNARRRAAALAFELAELQLAKGLYEELVEDSDTATRTEAAFALGEIARLEGRELEAEALFESAVTGPSGERAYRALSRIYEERGDARARYRLEDMMSQRLADPARATHHHLMAASLARGETGRRAAVQHLEAAFALAPSHIEIKHRLLDAVSGLEGSEARLRLLEAWAPREHEPCWRCEWYLSAAALYENQGNLAAAKRALEEAIKADPGSIEANEALYAVCQRLEEWYGAFQALGNIARYRRGSDEARAEVRIAQAELLAGPLGRREEARAYLLRALADVSHHPRGLRLLAELAEEAHDAQVAEDAWRRYLETGLEDGRLRALDSLVRLAKARGDNLAVLEYLALLWSETRTPESMEAYVEALRARGEFHRIAELLRDAAEHAAGEDRARYLWQAAMILRDSVGDWDASRRELTVIAEMPGEHGDRSRQALVELAREEGRPDLLGSALERQLRFAPLEQHGDLQLGIARARREGGDTELATAAYGSVLERDPRNTEALSYLAERAEERGDVATAFHHQVELLRLGGKEDAAALNRLTAHVPVEAAARVVRDFAKLPLTWATEIARRLEKEGHFEDAVLALDKALDGVDLAAERAPVVFEQLRLIETRLEDPAAALRRIAQERARTPDHRPFQERWEQLVERAGTGEQRAELHLAQAVASAAQGRHEPSSIWRAIRELALQAPSHPGIASAFGYVGTPPDLREELLAFVSSGAADRALSPAQVASILLALHAATPLEAKVTLGLARRLHSLDRNAEAAPLFAALYRQSPEDQALFDEWLGAIPDNAERRAARLLRHEVLSTAFAARGDDGALARLLSENLTAGLLEPAAVTQVVEAHVRAGDLTQALMWAKRATAGAPDDLARWRRRCQVALLAQAPDELVLAIDQLRQATLVVGTAVGDETLAGLSWEFSKALLASGFVAQAERLLRDILEHLPDHDDAYRALARLAADRPAELLAIAGARAAGASDNNRERRLRDWLGLALEARDPRSALDAHRDLAEAGCSSADDLAAAFRLAAPEPKKLAEVWAWAEARALALPPLARRAVADICAGSEGGDDLRAALLSSLPDKSDAELAYLGQRAFLSGDEEQALAMLRTELPRVLESELLQKLWLEIAAGVGDDNAKLELLRAKAQTPTATIDDRVALTEALLDDGQEGPALELLGSIARDPGLASSAAADRVRAAYQRLLLAEAERLQDSDPFMALARARAALAENPENAQAFALACRAAKKSGNDAALVALLSARTLDATQRAELGYALLREARPAEAAQALLAAHEARPEESDWLTAGLEALGQANDLAGLAEALVRFAQDRTAFERRAFLGRALALYKDMGATDREAALAKRLFEEAPGNEASFLRYETLVGGAGQERALKDALVLRLEALDSDTAAADLASDAQNARTELALRAARLLLGPLEDAAGADALLVRVFGDSPTIPAIVELRVDCLERAGDRASALAMLKVLAARSESPQEKASAWLRASEVAGQLGLGAEGAAFWAQAMIAKPDPAAYADRNARFSVLDPAMQARLLECFAGVLGEEEKREALLELAGTQESLGDHSRAIASARQALALAPEDPTIRQRLRDLYEASGDHHALVQLLGEEHAASLDRKERFRLAMEAGRRCAGDLKDADQAEHFYRQAAKDDPNESAPLQALLPLYQARDAKSELCDTLETLLTLLPESPQRGQLAMRLGDLWLDRQEPDRAALAYLYAFRDGVTTAPSRAVVRAAAERGIHVEQALAALTHLGDVADLGEQAAALRDAAALSATCQKDFRRALELLDRAAIRAPLTRAEHWQRLEWLEGAGDVAGVLGALGALAVDAPAEEREALSRRRLVAAEQLGDLEGMLASLQAMRAAKTISLEQRFRLLELFALSGQGDELGSALREAFLAHPAADDRARIKQAFLTYRQPEMLVGMLLQTAPPDGRGPVLCEAARLCEQALGDGARAYQLYLEALNEGAVLAPQDLTSLAALAEARGDDETLIDVYLRIAESDGPPATRGAAYLAMARTWLTKRKDASRAEDCLRACLRIAPELGEAERELARLFVAQRRFAEAGPLLERLRPGAGATAADKAEWSFNAGQAALATGDEGRARELFTEASAGRDDALWLAYDLEVKALNHLAAVRLVLNRLEWRQLQPGDVDRLKATSVLAQKAGFLEGEETLLRKLAEIGAADGSVFGRLHELALLRDDAAQAAAWLEQQLVGMSAGLEKAQALCRAASLAHRAGQDEPAQQHLLNAFSMAPSSIPVLDALFDGYSELGDAEHLLIVGERLIIVDSDSSRPQRFYVRLAEAAELMQVDAGRIFELYQLASRVGPLEMGALHKAIAAAGEAGNERQRLEWEEELVARGKPTEADYVHLGTLARDKLADLARAEKYFRQAHALNPKAKEPLKALAETLAMDRKKSFEAIETFRGLIGVAPTDLEAYRMLARLHGQVGDVDRTYLAYAALLAIDPADSEAEKFVAASRTIMPPLPTRPLLPNELGMIADPGLLTPLQQFFGPLATQAEQLYPGDLDAYGISEQNRMPLSQGLGAEVQRVLLAAGGRAPELQVYLATSGGPEAIIEPGAPPKLIITTSLTKAPLKVLQFSIARAVALLSLGHLLPSKLSFAEARQTVQLMAKRFSPELEVQGVDEGRAQATIERFAAVMPDDIWSGHGAVARQLIAHMESRPGQWDEELQAWLRAGDRTADRWALLVAGELGAAFGASKQSNHSLLASLTPSGPSRAEAIGKRDDLVDLLQFAMSDNYLTLRQATGLTLKR